MSDRDPTVKNEHKFWHDYVDTMPREDLLRLQETRFRKLVGECYYSSPLLRSLWDKANITPQDIRSLDDFHARVPFMNKDVIRDYRDEHDDPFGGLTTRDNPKLRMVTSTSGTTGDATPLTWSVRSLGETSYQRKYFGFGARAGDYVLHATFTFRVGHRHSAPGEAGLIPIVVDHNLDQVPRMVEASLRFRPAIFVMMSNPLMIAFEEYFEKHPGVDPKDVFNSYKSVFFGGEALAPRHRALAKSWGVELFEMMALGDVSIAVECEMHDGCHPDEDMAIIECLQPDGVAPVADGEVGELVVTMLEDPLLPLIRFRTDDLMVVNREPCGCGRTAMRYKMLGRKGDQIVVEGKTILPIHIRVAIEEEVECRGGLYQIIRPSATMERLRLRVGHNPGLLRISEADFRQHLSSKLEALLEVGVDIELVPDADLLKLGPPHKIPRVAKQ